ncbi:von Willebrand factor type A domain-containing protein [Singulisphaera sp. GP187]|uniref:vWA domain-containing protein n=1 Tax=Singulisphaera sp. GP187 TaxID=1882752 RepID=UPI00092B6920|nr:vWA domain-containing protein [Singulisphaera sp. GP187]SIO33127.1 von Willebrand factor type A domain-containing protein [Singulisphaera sp. GP187]
MALHVPTSSSSDGLYNLADSNPPAMAPMPPTEEHAPPPAAAMPATSSSASAPAPASADAVAAGQAGEPPQAQGQPAQGEAPKPKPKKKKRRKKRYDAPSWVVSLVIHVVVLAILGAATFSTEVRKAVANINSALVSGKGSEEEALHVLATPAEQRSDQAAGSEGAPAAASEGGGGGFSGIGTGPPSATPQVRGVGRGIGEGTSLPGVKVVANISGLSMIPTATKLGVDLGGGGMISGDITFEAKGVGEALDQLAREILRHLGQHKLTVVWLFDESASMKDDQRAINEKFDQVASALKINVDTSKKQAAPLTHAIVGFGKETHFELEKPTFDIDQIGKAIDHLRVDDSGTENTMQTIHDVIERYSPIIKKDRRLLIVLVTDESGDDGDKVEEARQAAISMKVPIYVIGRQSLFGFSTAHLKYVDPVTKDVYWPGIRRGPETADLELLQWDGLHERWEEQPSGFAPYELARLAKDTGGIYFLLPSEENMRVRQREKLYSIQTLKEYVPEYDNRLAYRERRTKSEFRRTLFAIIQETKGYPFRRHFPINPADLVPACQEAHQIATERLNVLLKIEDRLTALKPLRDREPLKRWQAHYDLMMAQVVAYQVKAYEYRACVDEMGKAPPKPKTMPSQSLVVEWAIDHSPDRKAPKENTQKKYVQAQALLKQVIEAHPKTPWADLAQDELSRGLGCQRTEWHHNPQYEERAKLIPKY